MLRALFFIFALAATPALAQAMVGVRGTIDAVADGGATLDIHARTGEPALVKVKPDARIVEVTRASLADVKPGAYVGVAAVEGADGVMKALEVHVFPEAMRGAGEGHRPFDLAPGSTMTNGALTARVDDVNGPMLTVSYPGGSKSIRITAETPIVALGPGDRAELKPGAAIVARGAKTADGAIEAAVVLVGKDGVTPPM